MDSYRYNVDYDPSSLGKIESDLEEYNRYCYNNNMNYSSKFDLKSGILSYSDIIEIEDILDQSIKSKDEYLELKKYTLKKLPKELKEFTWVKRLNVKNCFLQSLENLPPNIEELDASNNKILSLKKTDLPETLTIIKLEKNYISKIDIDCLPKNLIGIDLGDNELSELPSKLPEVLSYVSIAKNKFRKMPKFSNNITMLDVSANFIEDIDDLPDSIISLDCSKNEIINIRNLPKELKEFCACHNKISYIWHFTDKLELLDLSHNNISWIPTLPKCCKKIDLSHNKIRSFHFNNLPNNLEEINLENNDLEIPEHVKNNDKIKYNSRKSYSDNLNNNSLLWNYDNNNYYTNYSNNYQNRSYDNNYWNNYGSHGSYGSNGSYSSYSPYNSNSYGNYNYSGYGGHVMNSYSSARSKYNKTNPYCIIMKKKIEI